MVGVGNKPLLKIINKYEEGIMAKVGRPKGSTKPPTVSYHRRVRPEWVEVLDKLLKELKNEIQK